MRWLLYILLVSSAFGQGITASGGNMTKGGVMVWGATGPSSSHLVTVDLGGTTVNPTASADTAPNFILFTPFITPSIAGTWNGNCNKWWTSPDAGSPNWGCGIYSDVVVTGSVTSSGTTVTYSSGTNFDTTWFNDTVGAAITLNNAGTNYTYYIAAVASGTSLTTTQTISPACSPCTYTVHTPGALQCTAFTSSTASSGWNSLALSGCPAPTASTQYWMGAITTSPTQSHGGNVGAEPCPQMSQGSFAQKLASFTSNGSWPSNYTPSTGTGFSSSDGCPATYISYAYTTNAPYTIVSVNLATCDAAGGTCTGDNPATLSGDGMLCIAETSGSNAPNAACSDAAADTFTLVGSITTVTGGPTTHHFAMYYANRVTAGTTAVTCNFAGLNKDFCATVEINGTISSGSVDKSVIGTTTTGSNPFTGGTTATTTQAQELYIGIAVNTLLFSLPINASTFATNAGGWTYLATGYTAGNGPWMLGIYTQTVASTGTCTLTGSSLRAFSGSDATYTACVTLK